MGKWLDKMAFWRRKEQEEVAALPLEELEAREPGWSPSRALRRSHGLYGPSRGVRGEMVVIRSRTAR